MNNKSFTLIELLVVIVIIGILAGVIMISTSSSIDKANIAKSKVFESSIQNNLSANMISKWKLDEGTGISTADAWGTNTGTLVNSPTWRTGSSCVSENCLQFNGSNYVRSTLTNFLGGDQPHTISFWMYYTSVPSSRQDPITIGNAAISQYSAVDISTNNFNWYFYDNDTRLSEAPPTNQWVHICLTYVGGGATIINKKIY